MTLKIHLKWVLDDCKGNLKVKIERVCAIKYPISDALYPIWTDTNKLVLHHERISSVFKQNEGDYDHFWII